MKTYPARTGRKRPDKNRMRMFALFFEIHDVVNSRKLWFFFVDFYEFGFCPPALKSHQYAIHNPVKIDLSSFNLIIPTELTEFVTLNPYLTKTARIFKVKTIR